MNDENKRKHLEFIQLVITRMNVNSFLVKGWTITIISALFALAAVNSDRGFVILGLFPAIVFWFLDAYYLRQERLYRHLYDNVRGKDEGAIDYQMDATNFTKEDNTNYFKTLLSLTLCIFYLSLIIIIVFMMKFIKNLAS